MGEGKLFGKQNRALQEPWVQSDGDDHQNCARQILFQKRNNDAPQIAPQQGCRMPRASASSRIGLWFAVAWIAMQYLFAKPTLADVGLKVVGVRFDEPRTVWKPEQALDSRTAGVPSIRLGVQGTGLVDNIHELFHSPANPTSCGRRSGPTFPNSLLPGPVH